MPILNLRDIDVFAFVDSDSEEAKAFTTYAGYIDGLSRYIEKRYPAKTRFEALFEALERSGRLTRLRSKRYNGDGQPVRSSLINSWLSELELHLVDPEDPGLVRIANHAAPVHAYYSTTRSACAWLEVLTQSTPTTHAACLDEIARLVVTGAELWPRPWSYQCTAVSPDITYAGFGRTPRPVSNLARADVEPIDRIAMCLRTTRRRQVEKLVDVTRKQRRLKRAPNGEFNRRDESLRPTSIFDFLWRIRTRSNYGDPAMFYMGALTDHDVLAYLHNIKVITESTNFLFEAMLANRAPDVLADAADHFIARDRSGLTTEVLVPRLGALGLVSKAHRTAS